MSKGGLAELRRLLTDRYDALKAQLVRRLGSSELASDALHEAYVRLADRPDIDSIRHPQAYLLNTAVHSAIDHIRSRSRLLDEGQIEDLYDLPEPGAGPDRQAQDRDALRRAVDAMKALPPRQSDIFYSARVEGASREELAQRWGISVRQVNRELQAAHAYCARALGDWTGFDADPDGEAP